jgi:hypothetical protein
MAIQFLIHDKKPWKPRFLRFGVGSSLDYGQSVCAVCPDLVPDGLDRLSRSDGDRFPGRTRQSCHPEGKNK